MNLGDLQDEGVWGFYLDCVTDPNTIMYVQPVVKDDKRYMMFYLVENPRQIDEKWMPLAVMNELQGAEMITALSKWLKKEPLVRMQDLPADQQAQAIIDQLMGGKK